MKSTLHIAKMELQKMFYSPIAWMVLIVFAVQSSLLFMGIVENYIRMTEMGYMRAGLTGQIFAGMSGFFTRIQNTVYLYIPMITMGMMSKEFSTGSIKLLYSSPVTNSQIIWGKYFAALMFCVAMILLLFLESVFGLMAIKEVDFAMVMNGLLGMFLMIAAYSAIGLFWSTLTSYQIVALIGALATSFLLEQASSVGQTIDFVRDISWWLTIGGRSQSFIQGMITSEDFLYFVLVGGMFIAFSVFRLKGLRERSSKLAMASRYTGAFLVVALLGYFSALPGIKSYFDVTRTKSNTLTEKSQEVMRQMDGSITITTYTNLFGENAYFGVPMSQKRAETFFERYYRFYPDIDFDFKYYYERPQQERALRSFNRRYKDHTDEEALAKIANLYDMSIDEAQKGDAYIGEIDLESELNRFVRKIETDDGRVTYLRIFDDQQRVPFESQITAAFKRFTLDLPKVGFVTGHEERNVNDIGTRGYYTVAQEKPFRWSLINNGVDFDEIDLGQPVPEGINILLVAEAKSKFSESEMNNLNAYIERGGNLVLAADRKRQGSMNQLVEQFGVNFLPGQAVEYNKGYTMDFVTSQMTEEGKDLAYQFQGIYDEKNGDRGEGVVTMPGAIGLTYEELPGFTYYPLLHADSIVNIASAMNEQSLAKLKNEYADTMGIKGEADNGSMFFFRENNEVQDKGEFIGSWTEMQTTDFIDEIPTFDETTGEIGGPVLTGLAITREIGEKQQRILVLGDADCFSNGEISTRRNNINAQNFNFIAGMFYWLSHEVSPTDVRRPDMPDDEMLLTKDEVRKFKIFYNWVLPSVLLVSLLFIWLRRRGR